MRHLPKPLPDVPVERIYQECIDGFTDASFQKRLHTCSSLVKMDSTNYKEKIPFDIDTFDASELPDSITAGDLKKVYTQKFAKKGEPGRPYYNEILSLAPNGICPLCGIQQVRNLDHYLPKAKFPLLVVTPLNLVPVCRDCNFDKLTYSSDKPENAPLHPYFDDISNEIWLAVTLSVNRLVFYHVNCPPYWSEILKSRVENHLDPFKLHLYGCHAVQELSDNMVLWQKLYKRGGPDYLIEHISDVKESVEKNELNSWKSAMYRGMVDQFEVVKQWIQQT